MLVPVHGDTLDEDDELFLLTLGNPVGATIARAPGFGTIVNDDFDADLRVTGTATPAPVVVGGTLRYQVVVTNDGPRPATGVTMTMPVDRGTISSVSATSPAGLCVVPILALGAAHPVTCDGGALAPGGSVTLTVDVTPTSIGTLASTFTVSAQQADPVPGNNDVVVETEVSPMRTVVNLGGVWYNALNGVGADTPVAVHFADVTVPGILLADPMPAPPAPPAEFTFVSQVFDITTTAVVTGPITVCIGGTGLLPQDRLLHFDGSQWDDVTVAGMSTPAQVCGQSATLSPFALGRDVVPPHVQCEAADGRWHAQNVGLACAARDGGTGLASPADAAFMLTTSVAAGTETDAAATGSRTVCDAAGNCATAGPIGGNRVDMKGPSIAVGSPSPAATYALGQTVNADYSCPDGGSGIGTCSGPVGPGTPIDTSAVGTRTFTVDATDLAGNASSTSVTYQVVCRYVSLEISPATVAAGGTVTVGARVRSCSASAQTVTLRFTLSGPARPSGCTSVNSTMFTTLPIPLCPGYDRSVSFGYRVPQSVCAGTYSVTVDTLLNSRIVDSTTSTLTVRQ